MSYNRRGPTRAPDAVKRPCGALVTVRRDHPAAIQVGFPPQPVVEGPHNCRR